MITGSNNPFACEPVVFANANAIVSLGTITRDGNEFTFSVGFVWKINGVTYQNTAPVVLTIAEASTGFQRIDNALLNTSNTIELQQGLESETIALRPVAPDTNIILTSWNISGDAIGDTETPIVGNQFVKKTDFNPYISNVTGTDAIIPLDPNGYSEIRLTNASLTSIVGFDLSLITGNPSAEVPYNGKPYIIRNLTGNNITIKNEDLVNADNPFRLSGGADLVFPNGQAIYVLYDAAGFNEIFKSWSEVDLSTKLDKVSTAGVERAYIVNADGSQGTKATSEFKDVLEFADLASFPVTGESEKIYIDLATNLQYRWTGSAYVQIGGAEKEYATHFQKIAIGSGWVANTFMSYGAFFNWTNYNTADANAIVPQNYSVFYIAPYDCYLEKLIVPNMGDGGGGGFAVYKSYVNNSAIYNSVLVYSEAIPVNNFFTIRELSPTSQTFIKKGQGIHLFFKRNATSLWHGYIGLYLKRA